ncbi:MAG: tetratricopeptide repeat protein [Marinilabiliales bacterium]|nr:tetratricopeptide repeat protein [Marinilabiliales bacterium]
MSGYNEGDYSKALPFFMAFNNTVDQATRSDIAADARNRIADCYYIRADYPSAIAYYDKVIDYAKLDADYAMFQKGFAQGLSNNNAGEDLHPYRTHRASIPNQLMCPTRSLNAEGHMWRLEQPAKGEADFTNIIAWHTSSQFVPPAMVQLGLIYYNAGDNAKAIAQFKKVIENYRSTPEARNAVNGLRNAYTDMDDVEAYFAYMKTV